MAGGVVAVGVNVLQSDRVDARNISRKATSKAETLNRGDTPTREMPQTSSEVILASKP